MFAIGRPIGTARSVSSTTWRVDQIVVSVGPYTFQTDAPVASSSLASSVGKASPPQRMRSRSARQGPASTIIRHVVGVACTMVARDSAMSARSATGSAATSCFAITSRAPVTRGRKSSSAAMSNDRVVTETRTSRGRTARVARNAATTLASERCEI